MPATNQERVLAVLSDGREHSVDELRYKCRIDGEITARIRDLRTPECGEHVVESRKGEGAGHLYRLVGVEGDALTFANGVTIDPLFRQCCDPLRDDEYAQLRANIEAHGILHAITLWNDVIVDGHNRFEIGLALDINIPRQPIEFADRDEATAWILDNQFGRRNLSDYQRTRNRLRKKEMLAAKGKVTQGTRTDLSTNLSKGEPAHDTRAQIAAEAGVSEGTVAKVEFIEKHADPDTKAKVEAGDTSIHAAYTVTKELVEAAKETPKPRGGTRPRGAVRTGGGRLVTGIVKTFKATGAKLAERIRKARRGYGITQNQEERLSSALTAFDAQITKAIQEDN